ncbi:hypothetical protein [Emticicia sp. C21]|uniref:hypothetical protein n=1 Tax=Emticicia sp. C21 TaxID=2302915 RepID=UPI000E34D132|nr:hypothetical protein [Emticicia sp. C21]RFS18111.1 hypothetical protein D0T08_02355 [Emticicia sp. C21]
MNKPKDKIEELFQSHIDDFDKMPDDNLWADIEANLPPVQRPMYRLKRWTLVAALLLFSLIGYVAYQSLGTRQKTDIVGLKENKSKPDSKSPEIISKKGTKAASEANESNLREEGSINSVIVGKDAKNDKEAAIENKNQKDKAENNNKVKRKSENKIFIASDSDTKSNQLITKKERISDVGKNKTVKGKESEKQVVAAVTEDNPGKEFQSINRVEQENGNQQSAIAKTVDSERLSELDYLSSKRDIAANEIPLNTHIAYEAEYHPKEQEESFFKVPSEVYVSITPSLNYYRVFSNTVINQFNGANNGGRVGWALQAGAVYPLKFKRVSYRVGLSYFSAQSNFRYNVVNRTQMPVRLNNNTFEYVNVESLQSESRKWQVLEIQNDLMYKVRPMQDFILGFKAGSSFTEKPVFDAYTGYRFSKQVSNRQILWIEAAYAYAINSQKSSTHTFSYHMDKYSLKVGVNFR